MNNDNRYSTFSAAVSILIIAIGILLCMHLQPLFADQKEVSFDCYSVEEGLSQSTVLSIVQDDIGYMWFGTIDGLNRFDGYKFTVYRSDPADSNSLSDDWITSLFIDKNKTLWVGTLGGGLNCFHRSENRFSSYHIPSGSIDQNARPGSVIELPFIHNFLNANSITSIFEDRSGVLWIGTFGFGLFKFDRSIRTFQQVEYSFPSNTGLEKYIMSICETTDSLRSSLWISTMGGGLLRIDDTNEFSQYVHDPKNRESLSHNFLTVLYSSVECDDNSLWIGTLGGGLNRLDLGSGQFTRFKENQNNQNYLSDNSILSLLKDNCNNLWIGTSRSGIDYFDIKANKFTHFQCDLGNPDGLGSNEVLSLYEDRSGIVWIGTNLGHGINKMNMNKKKFNHFAHNPSNPNSLNDNVVFSFCQDGDRNLWIGTFKGGLNKYDQSSKQFSHYTHKIVDPTTLSDNHIRAIFEDSEGVLWIGTFNGGLNRFDRKNNLFKSYRHDPDNPNSIGGDQVRSIWKDDEGFLWFGTYGGGLDKFDPESETFIHYRHDPMDTLSISDNRIYDVQGDSRGYLWIATFEGGVNRLDPGTGRFTRYLNDPFNRNSLSENRVFSIFYDAAESSVIWFCTSGGGLDKYDMQNDVFVHYTEAEGLPNNVVYGILSDDEGFFWISTNKGISKFFPATETFTNYDVMDGLQSNEFNAGAFYRSPDGEMFFGGINGYNSFYPENVVTNPNIPPNVITSFKIFDQEMIPVVGSMDRGKTVELFHGDNFISFEFSALDYTNLKKNQYAYKLIGFHDDWIRCGTRRFVNFTNLDPGKYAFRVKGSNSDGVWNEEGTYINLIVHPPFWRRWWFYLLILATILLGTVILHKQRLKRMMQMEFIRLSENERVRKAVAADFHDELGQKLTRISLFSEIVMRKLKAASLEDLEYIEKINTVSKELAGSTRDFIWTLDPDQDTLYDVVVYLKDFGDDVFSKTGKIFRVYGIKNELKKIKLPVEWRRHLILIFKEGMNNILKHASCNNIVFDIVRTDNQLRMTLSDDGVGCNLNDIPPRGQGITNMKNRADSINGILTITQNIGSGIKIQFTGEIPQMGH